MLQLATDDKVMELHRHLGVESPIHHLCIKARNWTHHRLMSLPCWQELAEDERSECPQGAYEICRVTAILYSTAVIFPMPANTGWYLKEVEALANFHKTFTLRGLPGSTNSSIIWALWIAGMAAMHTPHRNFFVTALRSSLVSSGLLSWPAVTDTLARFLWSEPACGRGGKLLWELLGLEAAPLSFDEVI